MTRAVGEEYAAATPLVELSPESGIPAKVWMKRAEMHLGNGDEEDSWRAILRAVTGYASLFDEKEWK